MPYGRHEFTTNPLLPDSIGNNPLLQPVAILDSKPQHNDSTGDKLVLVQWEGLAMEDTTWEIFSELQQAYSDLHLENKELLQPGKTNTNHNLDTDDKVEDSSP